MPQGLYTGCSLCQEHSPPISPLAKAYPVFSLDITSSRKPSLRSSKPGQLNVPSGHTAALTPICPFQLKTPRGQGLGLVTAVSPSLGQQMAQYKSVNQMTGARRQWVRQPPTHWKVLGTRMEPPHLHPSTSAQDPAGPLRSGRLGGSPEACPEVPLGGSYLTLCVTHNPHGCGYR